MTYMNPIYQWLAKFFEAGVFLLQICRLIKKQDKKAWVTLFELGY